MLASACRFSGDAVSELIWANTLVWEYFYRNSVIRLLYWGSGSPSLRLCLIAQWMEALAFMRVSWMPLNWLAAVGQSLAGKLSPK